MQSKNQLNTKISMPILFEHTDFREYLKTFFEIKKQINTSYSLRVLSDQIGFKAKDYIMRIMNGERNLSIQAISKVSKGLKFNDLESRYFNALVRFNQAKQLKDAEIFLKEMKEVLKAVNFTSKQHHLLYNQYAVYANWYHLIIRSLIGMYGFNGDFDALAQKVYPQITPEEAKSSVDLLLKCKLISKLKSGEYKLSSNAITTGNSASKLALLGFHQQFLRLGALSLENVEGNKRNISALTLGISKSGYDQIIEKLNVFRKEVAFIAEEDKMADKVYQLQLLLYPVGGK